MTLPGASAPLKQATLEALGYGMNQTELSPEVRLAAVKALYNALDFAESNFANEMERNYIMKVICDTAVSNAVKGDEEPVALQAVEFWSAICDEEIALQDEYEGSDDGNSTIHFRFIEKALPSLVPMLLETLLKQEEDQDQDDNVWNISMSGGTCLGLIARTVGPSVEKLAPLVQAGLDFLLNTMNDSNSQVKDTTAWTLGRVFELLHSPAGANPIINNSNLPRYEDAESMSSVLTPYLPNVIAALLNAADRADTTHFRLRASAYEALNEIVIIQKLSSTDAKSIIAQTADQLMTLFLRVFACHSSTVHEEAMLAIGALAYATGVVGDICRALEDKILPFCDRIMTVLLKDLSNSMLNRSVKPPIFSCLGDIALAIGENFEKYLPYAMPMLQGAAGLLGTLDQSDDDMVDYGNQLRRGIFEAYSGILQGIKGPKAQLMIPYATHLLQFTEAVFKDRSRDDSVTKSAVAVLGDLADTLGTSSKGLFQTHLFHVEFLRECLDSDDEVRETASWAQGMINQAVVS
ncbi:Importin subunit beta-1 [Dichanthelium oligosanthes]|uniref:Importin subunit beta-1 n=1 Tax=Dichanthelium oligosanthes TaxID=888268 RepID=A0A1E5VL65_9POAL|nr:Importin subunit beta-1 [Dichanthelium oligosanthes]